MTNKISSAEQAMDALLKARQMSARIKANFSAISASVSIEGKLFDANLMDVEIEGSNANLRLSPMIECHFDGEISDNTADLLITYRGADVGEVWRCSINATW